MAPKIRLLPNLVVSQIAAGEVIQRPKSALKELIENAIDAKATKIKVIIEEGGKRVLQVLDNGVGMTPEDARLAFVQNTTSKLQALEDLVSLSTYGFRGEALSSIRSAAVRVVLKTKTKNEKVGIQITMENGKIEKEEPVAMEQGTQISIYNLFGNIPARLHFLKSNAIEGSHVIDVFQQMALVRPEIAFSLYQNKKEIYQLPVTQKISQRIVHLLGKNYQQDLLPCEETIPSVSIKGYIGRPDRAKKRTQKHFLYVNGRHIKSAYLHHAVKKGYENLIPPEFTPFYALFIEIDPKKIDVNIHPTKAEVKFEEEKLVYALIAASIKKALSQHQILPSLDFNEDQFTSFPILATTPPSSTEKGNTSFSPKEESTFFVEKKANPYKQPSTEEPSLWHKGSPQEQPPSLSPQKTTIPKHRKIKERERAKRNTLQLQNKLQVHGQYIFIPSKSGILIIQQQRAYERILYEESRRKKEKSLNIQQLLFPIKVSLEPSTFTLLKACKKELRHLGFEIEIKPQNQIFITGQPSGIKSENLADLFVSILEEYKSNFSESKDKRESWIQALSKKAATAFNKPLSLEEMNSLVDRLFLCENPNYTPTGKRIWQIFSLQRIGEWLVKGEERESFQF